MVQVELLIDLLDLKYPEMLKQVIFQPTQVLSQKLLDPLASLQKKGNIIESQVGDIQFTVHVENKTPYIRQGLDIILKEKISLKQSLCGFILEFTYLNGKKFALNNMDNYTIIKPEFKKIIPNMGLTRESSTGNLIVHFEVEFPNTLEKDVRDKLNEIL